MKKPKFDLKKTVQSRSFQVGGYSVAATAIVVAIVIAVNLLVSALPSSMTQLDATSNQLYTISDQTKKLVSSLEEDVTIYWIVQSGSEDSTIENLLGRYESLSDHVDVVKKDPDVYPTFAQNYTSGDVYNNSLVVETADRCRYIDYNDIFVMDYYSYYYYGTYSYTFYGETELTSAIDYCVSAELPTVYTLTGHGESDLASSYQTAVEKENLQLEELSLLTAGTVPKDAGCVLINCPQTDISAEEAEALEEYLAAGGKLVVITDPPQDGALTNLEGIMGGYGVTTTEGIVVEGSSGNYAWGTPYYLLPEIESHTITSPLIEEGYYVLLPIAQGLTISDELPEDVSVTSILSTSDDAFSKVAGYGLTTYEKEDGDLDGPFSLGVVIEDEGTGAEIIWFSSAAIVDEQSSSQVSGGNQDLFLNALNYLCEAEESGISIHAKTITEEYLTIDSGTVSLLSILVIAVIPLAYLGVGITITIRRKRR